MENEHPVGELEQIDAAPIDVVDELNATAEEIAIESKKKRAELSEEKRNLKQLLIEHVFINPERYGVQGRLGGSDQRRTEIEIFYSFNGINRRPEANITVQERFLHHDPEENTKWAISLNRDGDIGVAGDQGPAHTSEAIATIKSVRRFLGESFLSEQDEREAFELINILEYYWLIDYADSLEELFMDGYMEPVDRQGYLFGALDEAGLDAVEILSRFGIEEKSA